jgi:D-arabinose 1-dehydrogenase-like Zn-dependent alcohol dehydrogenase
MLVEGQLPAVDDNPVTIGHEATGLVLAVGSKVKGFRVGDYIGFINAYHACFKCRGCANHYIYCTSGSMVMQGFSCNGYFQQYCAIDSGTAVVLPQGMDPAVSSPIFCAGITGYQAVLKAGLSKGETLAVVGCGGLGQLAIKYAKAMGLKVIAIDVDANTLATAKASGADHAFNSRREKDTYIEVIHKLTNGGCDAVAVFAAVKAGYDSAPAVLRVGGHMVIVGIPKDDISVSAFDLTMMKYHISAANNAADPPALRKCAEFTAKHNISSPSKFYKLEQINEMIGIMQRGEMAGLRMVVKFDEGQERASL